MVRRVTTARTIPLSTVKTETILQAMARGMRPSRAIPAGEAPVARGAAEAIIARVIAIADTVALGSAYAVATAGLMGGTIHADGVVVVVLAACRAIPGVLIRWSALVELHVVALAEANKVAFRVLWGCCCDASALPRAGIRPTEATRRVLPVVDRAGMAVCTTVPIPAEAGSVRASAAVIVARNLVAVLAKLAGVTFVAEALPASVKPFVAHAMPIARPFRSHGGAGTARGAEVARGADVALLVRQRRVRCGPAGVTDAVVIGRVWTRATIVASIGSQTKLALRIRAETSCQAHVALCAVGSGVANITDTIACCVAGTVGVASLCSEAFLAGRVSPVVLSTAIAARPSVALIAGARSAGRDNSVAVAVDGR